MRIRKRFSSSSSQNPDPSLQHQLRNGGTRGESIGLIPNGDLQLQLDPKPNHTQVIKQEKEKELGSSPSPHKTLDSQLHNNVSCVKEEVNDGRKRRNPGVLMEGSRCSRVNGRGWRCSQQTLIGYSLSEHHLGKGRLRSVASVQGGVKVMGNTARNSKKKLFDEEKRGRKKIGMLKARSMNSLIDESNHLIDPAV